MANSDSTGTELKPGWLKRELARVKKEVQGWPQWKKDALEHDTDFAICQEKEDERRRNPHEEELTQRIKGPLKKVVDHCARITALDNQIKELDTQLFKLRQERRELYERLDYSVKVSRVE